MERKVSLIELCGGADEAKQEFLKLLNTIELTDAEYAFLLKAWDFGFISYNNMVFDAMREGNISITVFDSTGDAWNLKPVALPVR